MSATRKTNCTACGEPVLRTGNRVLNATHNPRGITHNVTCTAREKTPVTDSIFDSIPVSDEEKVKRDRWGRPLIIPPDGGKPVGYQRCTTFVGCLEDTFNLSRWQQRMVALGLAARPDLLLSVSAHSDDKEILNKVCDEAREAAAASAAATTGTALHRIAERLDRGEDITVPVAAKADIDAYQQATAQIGWSAIETMMVADDLKVAGTPDRIGQLDDGRPPFIADLKTGSIDFGIGKIAMQLAVYAHSRTYNVTSGERGEISLDLDRALIIHLPAGQGMCELVWVDIAAGWEAVQLARQVHAWRKRKNLTTPFQSVAVDLLAALIDAATDPDVLTRIYREHRAEWTDMHTELARQRKTALLAAVA
jgi:hypothetical protein